MDVLKRLEAGEIASLGLVPTQALALNHWLRIVKGGVWSLDLLSTLEGAGVQRKTQKIGHYRIVTLYLFLP